MVRSILVPVDDSPLADKAMDHAFTLAARFGARVQVLSVGAAPASEVQTAALRARVDQRLGNGHHVPASSVDVRHAVGEPLPVILATAKGVDLVVMGTHGRQNLADRLFGSTTERVLLEGTSAMLIVRDDAAEPA